ISCIIVSLYPQTHALTLPRSPTRRSPDLGSVHLNQGGTEMGQGLYIKVAQVVAEEFQIDIEHVKITATTTGKVPNTSATAASSGSEEHTSELQSRENLVCRLLLEKKKNSK